MKRQTLDTAELLAELGVSPATVARLTAHAESEDFSLRDLVRFILSDYSPPQEIDPDEYE